MAKRKDLVTFIPLMQANTPVTHDGRRFLVYTDPNDPNPAVSEPELERAVAMQLVAKRIGTIAGDDEPEEDEGEDDDDARESDQRHLRATGGTVASTAKRRVAKAVEADNASPLVTGADTRDTTAHVRPPLATNAQPVEPLKTAHVRTIPGEGDDAPPIDGSAAPAGPATAAAPKRKRIRSRSKKVPAKPPAEVK